METKNTFTMMAVLLAGACAAGPVEAGWRPNPGRVPELTLYSTADDRAGQEYALKYAQLGDAGGAGFPWEALRAYKVLFVPGIFSNVFIQVGLSGGLPFRAGEYFNEQMNDLRVHGVEFERVEIESETGPEYNARVIEDAVRRSRLPVIFVTHSKGGLDTLEMLLTNPEIRDRIRGWIPIQSPFQGSPVADYFNNRRFLAWVSTAILEALHGSVRMMQSLTMRERVPYMNRSIDEIERLARLFPVLPVASAISNQRWKVDTLLEPVRNILIRLGYETDGVVPWQSAVLPGAEYVRLTELDHMSPVMFSPVGEFDRVRFTRALLAMVLERVR